MWLAFVVACLAISALVPARAATSVETGTGESARAAVLLRDAGLTGGAIENVLITARGGRWTWMLPKPPQRPPPRGWAVLPKWRRSVSQSSRRTTARCCCPS
ncbi:hypothetical protein NKG94_51980 [Micromonospora sp. M12]